MRYHLNETRYLMFSAPIQLTPALVKYLVDHSGKAVTVTINPDLTVSFREPGFRTS